MNPVTYAHDRLVVLRRDALLVEGVIFLLGLGYVLTLTVAGEPGWYAYGLLLVLFLTLVSPNLSHLLLPAALLAWWFSGIPVGSAYSLPAAWCLLGLFSGTALLTAFPDGVPLSREIVVRYVQRTAVVAGLTTGVWALGMLLARAHGTSVLLTTAAFLALAGALIILPRLISPSAREGEHG